ncbi:hypothetical protein M7775_13465 [Sporomusa sphaeroides DSM 2875]|uniref:hypothetical protein n=1 Tax=Sporomusa sphaeroides TaxID=47679 RepID=UPI00202FA77E|nr:hypothetical protein [Sporomusa sphaeroides]MCM0759561.1 hypothetical protein [Sporomusa sphaeroides DSM 2875]
MGKNIWLRYAVYSFFGLLLLMIVSSAVLPALSMNAVQGGMAGNMGQMPVGYTNMGQMPMGNMNMGQMPMGYTNMGQMPMGNMNMGQMPMGMSSSSGI